MCCTVRQQCCCPKFCCMLSCDTLTILAHNRSLVKLSVHAMYMFVGHTCTLIHALYQLPRRIMSSGRQAVIATAFQLLDPLPAYQRLSLRLGTSDVSNEGFCCNLCAPLVVDIHLKQSNWGHTRQGNVQQADCNCNQSNAEWQHE